MKKIPENINKAISEFITSINNKFGKRIKKIILYGSYARGDFNTSSDIDIMNVDRFNYWLEALPFYMNVQKEGVVLSES